MADAHVNQVAQVNPAFVSKATSSKKIDKSKKEESSFDKIQQELAEKKQRTESLQTPLQKRSEIQMKVSQLLKGTDKLKERILSADSLLDNYKLSQSKNNPDVQKKSAEAFLEGLDLIKRAQQFSSNERKDVIQEAEYNKDETLKVFASTNRASRLTGHKNGAAEDNVDLTPRQVSEKVAQEKIKDKVDEKRIKLKSTIVEKGKSDVDETEEVEEIVRDKKAVEAKQKEEISENIKTKQVKLDQKEKQISQKGREADSKFEEEVSEEINAKRKEKQISLGDLIQRTRQPKRQGFAATEEKTFNIEKFSSQKINIENKEEEIAINQKALEQVKSELNQTLNDLVEAFDQAPASILTEGPTPSLVNRLEVIPEKLSQAKKSVGVIENRLNDFSRQASQLANDQSPISTLREAEITALEIRSAEPQDAIAKAQKRLTPDAVSQLLF